MIAIATPAAPADTELTWNASRDKYGRPVKELHRGGRWTRPLGVVVTLPKGYAELYPEHGGFLVNDWSMGYQADSTGSGQVTYHATLKIAKKFLEDRHSAS